MKLGKEFKGRAKPPKGEGPFIFSNRCIAHLLNTELSVKYKTSCTWCNKAFWRRRGETCKCYYLCCRWTISELRGDIWIEGSRKIVNFIWVEGRWEREERQLSRKELKILMCYPLVLFIWASQQVVKLYDCLLWLHYEHGDATEWPVVHSNYLRYSWQQVLIRACPGFTISGRLLLRYILVEFLGHANLSEMTARFNNFCSVISMGNSQSTDNPLSWPCSGMALMSLIFQLSFCSSHVIWDSLTFENQMKLVRTLSRWWRKTRRISII